MPEMTWDPTKDTRGRALTNRNNSFLLSLHCGLTVGGGHRCFFFSFLFSRLNRKEYTSPAGFARERASRPICVPGSAPSQAGDISVGQGASSLSNLSRTCNALYCELTFIF